VSDNNKLQIYKHHSDCVTADIKLPNTKIPVTRTAIHKILFSTQGFSFVMLPLKVRCLVKNVLGNVHMEVHILSKDVILDAISYL
jgi:hypothetical protein